MRTKCKSELIGFKCRLRSNYDGNLETFKAYNRSYSIATRLGFKSAEEAWKANPIIEGSVQPWNLRVSRLTPINVDTEIGFDNFLDDATHLLKQLWEDRQGNELADADLYNLNDKLMEFFQGPSYNTSPGINVFAGEDFTEGQ